jgi:hypothetical protein
MAIGHVVNDVTTKPLLSTISSRLKTSNIRIKTNRITTGELIDDKPEEVID